MGRRRPMGLAWRLSGSGSSFLPSLLFYRALGGRGVEQERSCIYISKDNATAKAKVELVSKASRGRAWLFNKSNLLSLPRFLGWAHVAYGRGQIFGSRGPRGTVISGVGEDG